MKEWLDMKALTQRLGRYRYVLLVGFVGLLLLVLPGRETKLPAAAESTGDDLFRLGAMELRLEQVLSQIEGAGRVTVALTLQAGPRELLAQDGDAAEGDHETRRQLTTVVVSRGGGGQEAVRLQQIGPVYLGAVVVSPGADSPTVRLALSQAVSALTGLGADKIEVIKGK